MLDRDYELRLLLEKAEKACQDPFGNLVELMDTLSCLVNSSAAGLIYTVFKNYSSVEKRSESLDGIKTITDTDKLLENEELVQMAEKKFTENTEIALDVQRNLDHRTDAIEYLGLTRDENAVEILFKCYQTPFIKGCCISGRYYHDWNRYLRPSLAERTKKWNSKRNPIYHEEQTWEYFVNRLTDALARISSEELLDRIFTDENELDYIRDLALKSCDLGIRFSY